ncbi:MAG: hypothetical protein QME81_09295 [bacterium]|nr:hypothetical protein [bacterium]
MNHPVDVYIFKGGAFQKEEFRRRQLKAVNCSPERTAYIATPEDTILHKLLWYKMGGGVSDRQWMDVTGVMKVQGNTLDLNYLRHWAGKLKVLEELERALSEVK